MRDTSYAIFILKIIVFSIAIGALVPLVLEGRYETPLTAVIAGLNGFLIGAGCSTVELTLLSNRSIRWLRQVPLIALVGMRAALYSLIIFAGLVLPDYLLLGQEVWQSPDFPGNFTVAAMIAALVSLSLELLRLLGREATISIFTGRYRRPRQENRIILFADLVGSTTLAERLGELAFHEFLADVAYDLSDPIERHGGDVHRYVGDAIVVTWPMTAPGNFEKSAACAMAMPVALRSKAQAYHARYGQDAQIRIALHCGPVAAGEIGTWKKEIALLGDTMNTVARIENAARDLGADVVISDAVKAHLTDAPGLTLAPLPGYAARGKQDQLALWALSG